MESIKTLFMQISLVANGLYEGNSLVQFISAATILVLGFLILEIFWRYAKKKMELFEEKGKTKKWKDFFIAFAPAFRLACAVLIIRLAEIPLVVPEELMLLIHGLEIFLFCIAIIIFIFQAVKGLELIYPSIPSPIRKAITQQRIRNFESILRILGIVAVALFFVYTQQYLFPQWVCALSLWRYAGLLVLFVILFLGGKFIVEFLEALVAALSDSSEKARIRLVLRSTTWPIRLVVVAIAIYAMHEILYFPDTVDRIFEITINIIGIVAVFIFLYKLLDVVECELIRFVGRDDNEFDMNLVQLVRITAKVLIIVFGAIYLLKAATGKPMTTLLAGLGIGGLAVALAAQDTLKNLFGSFMLMIDKPFVVGEWVNIEGSNAIVEEIGFRCTRIRTFNGHVISIPNEKMAAISIENVQRRPFIRRTMNITVTLDTPPDKVEKAVQIIKDILKDRPELDINNIPKVHFNEFNDTSLNIIVVYYFKEKDYWASIRFNEIINLEIMRAFEAEGIEFAFPTTTTYLAYDNRRPLAIDIRNTKEMKAMPPNTAE
ncbi:MAG: mechanosensitive ion channel family protein [Syntrophales bacterium]|nr:mechanosensitive ion channel family protein [Syntrophales bacterium]